MTALPPAGHLRDELARALPASVGPAGLRTRDENVAVGQPFTTTQLGDIVLDALLPVVARALAEARADGAVDALMWSALTVEHSPDIKHQAKAVRAIRDRATSLRASIRQTDERN